MSPEVARLVTGFMESLAPAFHECERLSARESQMLELLADGPMFASSTARLINLKG
jgi:hypothetical protein